MTYDRYWFLTSLPKLNRSALHNAHFLDSNLFISAIYMFLHFRSNFYTCLPGIIIDSHPELEKKDDDIWCWKSKSCFEVCKMIYVPVCIWWVVYYNRVLLATNHWLNGNTLAAYIVDVISFAGTCMLQFLFTFFYFAEKQYYIGWYMYFKWMSYWLLMCGVYCHFSDKAFMACLLHLFFRISKIK